MKKINSLSNLKDLSQILSIPIFLKNNRVAFTLRLGLIVFFAILLLTAKNSFSQDFAKAKELAKQKVLADYSDKIDKVAIYMADKIVLKSDEQLFKDYHHENIEIPFEESIMIFIDLMPEADWGHPCKYIFINPETKEEYVYHSMFMLPNNYYFDINRINEISEGEKSIDSVNLRVIEEIERLKNFPKPKETDNSKFAILIAGGASRTDNHERYYNNIQLMYNTLVKKYAYPEEQIFVFFAGGAITQDNHYDDNNANTHVNGAPDVEIHKTNILNNDIYPHRSSDLDGDGDCDISNAARINDVINLIDGDLLTALQTNSNEKALFIYTYDHGFNESYEFWDPNAWNWDHFPPGPFGNWVLNPQVNDEVKLCMWRENWDDDNFVNLIDKQPYRSLHNLNITMHQCFSGGFEDELASNSCQLNNVVFTAAANYYEVGYSGSSNKYAQKWVLSAAGENFNDIDANSNSELELSEIHIYTRNNINNLDQSPDIPTQNKPKQHPRIFSKPNNQATISRLGHFLSNNYQIEGFIKFHNNIAAIIPLYNQEIRLYHEVLGIDVECGGGVNNSELDGSFSFSTNTDDDLFIKVKLQNDFLSVIDDDWNPLWMDIFEFKSQSIEPELGFNQLDFTIANNIDDYQACNIFNVASNSQKWFEDRFSSWGRYKTNPPLHEPNPDDIHFVWIGSNTKNTEPGFNAQNDYIGVADENLWNSTYLNYHYSLANIYNIYEYAWPETYQGVNQGLNKVSNETTALINGFAWFLTAAIADNPNSVEFNSQNIETNTWWQGQSGNNLNGRNVEGAIASFFWDLYDNTNESGDNQSGFLFEIWSIFTEHKPNDIGDFIALWSNSDISSCLHLNKLLFDNNIFITNPTEGNPLIVDHKLLSPVTLRLQVKDANNNVINNLSIENFKIEANSKNCEISNLILPSSSNGYNYLVEFVPANQSFKGLYPLKATFLDAKGNTSSDVVLSGLLYTNIPQILKGLAYLASIQSTAKGTEQQTGPSIDPYNIPEQGEDKIAGHWSGNTGITALCLQAFLANGHGADDPLYGTNVTNAITYILSRQITSGYQLGAFYNTEYGYGTAMAIVALDAALKSGTLVEPLLTQVTNAVNLALNYYTQDVNPAWTNVSWRYDRSYTSQLSGDMSVNQWVYLALNAKKYTDKDIWNKIYGYINTRKASSGGRSWVGYQTSGTWTRGNTCAGIWGLKLAQQNGVVGADALSQQMYNYLEQYTLTELFAPSSISTHVYDGGGYYYYTYELAKSLALGGKTNFSGGNWYEHMYNKIDSQKKTNASGNYYWDEWGGQGAAMETAQAILSLQVGTVPVGSKISVILTNAGGAKSGCLEFSVSDEFGNTAGMLNEVWYTDIPNSEWVSTGDDIFELVVYLERATSFSTLIINNCGNSEAVNLAFNAYVEDNIADTEEFDFEIDPSSAMGASAFVNAIGGLNVIITDPPSVMPILSVQPSSIEYNIFNFNNVYNFSFDVKEIGGETPLTNIDIFSSGLSDENGNFIPGGNFSFSPSTITSIPPGSSVTVNGTLITPATLPNPTGVFQGLITAQTNQQAKAIQFVIGSSVPLVYNVTGGGGYCIGAVPTGVSVGLNGSQGALQYQLFRNNNAFGTPVNGTGTPLIWNNVPSGTYTVGAVTGASYFMMDGSVQVIEQLPVAIGVEIVADQNGVCTGTEVNFVAYPENSGTGPVFLWNVNDVFTGVYGTEYSYIPSNGDMVTLLMVTNNYCTTNGTAITSAPITMVVNPNLPVSVSISSSQSNVIEGNPVTLTASAVNGGNNPVFQWKVNGNNVGSNTNTFTYTPLNNDAVICILTSSENCVLNNQATSNTINIVVQPPSAAVVNITASANNVCAGTNVIFTATTVNAGTDPTYQWKVNGITQGGNSSTFVYQPADNDVVILTILVNNGGAAGTTANSNQVLMLVEPLLPVGVSISASANNICEGTSITYTATALNGGLSPIFDWFINGVSQSITGPVYTYQPQNEDIVFVTLNSSESCTSGNPAQSNEIGMNVNPKLTPVVTISTDQNDVCLGTYVTINAVGSHTGNNPAYYWYVNNINVGNNSTSLTYKPANGDQIKVVLVSDYECLIVNTVQSNILTINVIEPMFNIVTEPAEAGNATVQGNIGLGNPVLLQASSNTGWVFSHWSDQAGNTISGNPILVYYITDCYSLLYANFSWETKLIGQLKYFNPNESVIPSPNQHSIFYAQLFENGEAYGEKQQIRFSAENELESSFEFRAETGSSYTIRIWEESMNVGLQNSWTWNNWGGVSALDALIVNYMVVQNPVLENYPWIVAPNQKLDYTSYFSNVADANNSNTTTSLDALMLLYRMVNYPNTSPFPGGRHNFQFAGKYAQSLNEPSYPIAPEIPFTVNGSYTANSPTMDVYYEAEIPVINQGLNVFDTYLVATGDLNASYLPNNPLKSDILLSYGGTIHCSPEDDIWIPFKIMNQTEVGAITLDLKYDNSLIEVLDLTGFDIFKIDHEVGIIKIAWMDIEGKQFAPEDELLQLKVKLLTEIDSNQEVFDLLPSTEFVDKNVTLINGLTLSAPYIHTGTTNIGESNGSDLSHAIYPNPIKNTALLKYLLPEAGKVKILIYNNVGQPIMLLHEGFEMPGSHSISISNDQFNSNGAYFYKIEFESSGSSKHGIGGFILFK